MERLPGGEGLSDASMQKAPWDVQGMGGILGKMWVRNDPGSCPSATGSQPAPALCLEKHRVNVADCKRR